MSMNKKTRSLINTKYESQRIYYQRREIKKKDKQIQELTNNWNELEGYFKQHGFWHSLDKMKEIKEGNNDIS